MGGITSRQNGSKGGRPPGRKNEATLEREAQLERLRQRVFEAFDPLINAQLSLAQGISYLFKEGINDDGSKGKPILVTDPDEILAYLAEDYNALSTTYYITTKAPENAALTSARSLSMALCCSKRRRPTASSSSSRSNGRTPLLTRATSRMG